VGKHSKQRQSRRRAGAAVAAPEAADAALIGALELLARRRAPYADLLAAIVADSLRRFPPDLDPQRPGAILEIGAGTGQLRTWLPPAIAARTLATDPSARALALLRRRAPAARALTARAENLPVAAGALGGVLGLCVFDAIHAAGSDAAAVAEIARVLAPGGRFIHVLDMATLLDAPFAKLAAGGLVPIPNVFGDPSDHLSGWPLDLLLLRRDWIAGLLALSARAGDPLAAEFGGFFRAFLAQPFNAAAATRMFQALASEGERRFALSSRIAAACRLAIAAGYPTLQPMPFHSGRYLASVIETAFKDSGAFRVEVSEIVTRSAWRDAAGPAAPAPAYRSLALGHERVLGELPARLLDDRARARPDPPGATLVEASVYLFVATRVTPAPV
jgi:SAM-dependent methyltransferase